jgi:hypothetical protein
MKFTRKDTPTIMDGMVVRYQIRDFEINVSRNGISTDGPMPLVRRVDDLDVVIEYFRRAFLQFRQLEPNRDRLYGSNEPLTEETIDKILYGVKA